jgi:hypothetical protein
MQYEAMPPPIQYPQIASELEKMHAVDQDMRGKSERDDGFWDYDVDRKNTEWMKQIVSEIGWPTISKVGESGAEHAWLLVQHADHDVAFQRHCLELMKALPESEVEKRNIAYLEDRVLLKETGFQTYGTQFNQIEGKHVPQPIQDPERVNQRRKKMGLDTLEEGIKEMYEAYGVPPDRV